LRNTFIIVYLILHLGIAVSSFASEKIPVDIKADQLSYFKEQQLITASGNVQLNIENSQVLADQLIFDVGDKTLWATGNVTISQGNILLRGQSVAYRIASADTVVSALQMISDDPEIKGHLYLKAQQASGRLNADLAGQSGELTTCEYSHYRIDADSFRYIPGDRVEGQNVRFKVAEQTIFYTPYYVFWLKDSEVIMPIIGQNETEGWFIKTGQTYRLNELVGGTAYIDWMQKKGLGLGARNRYYFNERNYGTAYLYNVREQDTGVTDWIGRIDHYLGLADNTTLNLKYDSTKMYLVPEGRVEYQNYELTVKEETASNSIQASLGQNYDLLSRVKEQRLGVQQKDLGQNFNYDYTYRDYQRDHFSEAQVLDYRKNLVPGTLDSQVRFNYYRDGNYTGPADEKLFSSILLKQGQGALYKNLVIDMEMFTDLDRELYTGDNTFSYLEKLPEITAELNSTDLGLFAVDTSLGAGRFREVQYISSAGRGRDFSTERYQTVFNIRKDFELDLGSTLKLSRRYEQYFYGSGDSQFINDDQAGHYLDADNLKNRLVYHHRYSNGQSPFYFDQRGNELRNITDLLTFFDQERFVWNINSGYNFNTRTYDDIMTDITYRPDDKTSLLWKSGYNLERDRDKLVDMITVLSYKPSERTAIQLENALDLNKGVFKSASSELKYGLGEGGEKWADTWDFRVKHVYDLYSGRYMLRELEIAKDLHCWTAQFRYDQFREEYLLVFTLKAWDKKPLRFYGGREGVKMSTDWDAAPSRL
jgi:lipopolysaccharide export system protein LptA